MSTTTLLTVKVATRGEVDSREKLKIVLSSVRGSNIDDPPKEINLERLYPSRGIEMFHRMYPRSVLHLRVSSSPKQTWLLLAGNSLKVLSSLPEAAIISFLNITTLNFNLLV